MCILTIYLIICFQDPESAPAPTDEPAPALGADEDLDFSSIKKKSKSKKAALDMEAFEKELKETKARDGDDDDEEVPHGEDLEIDGDIGEDVFAQGEAPQGIESGNEAWLKSDRDYIYPEVHILPLLIDF
jgi:translation initiation factor 2 subunit 2